MFFLLVFASPSNFIPLNKYLSIKENVIPATCICRKLQIEDDVNITAPNY